MGSILDQTSFKRSSFLNKIHLQQLLIHLLKLGPDMGKLHIKHGQMDHKQQLNITLSGLHIIKNIKPNWHGIIAKCAKSLGKTAY